MRLLIHTTLLTALLTVTACAQEVPVSPKPQITQSTPTTAAKPAQKLPADPNKFAVVITGIGGEEVYVKQFGEWTTKLRQSLTGQLGFAEEQVFVLTEKPEGKDRKATSEAVRQLFVELKNTLKPDNQLFLFFIGHGSYIDKVAKFNLVGPDLSATEYGQLLNSLPAKNVVIVNTASGSGEFVKPLAREGRVVITATRSGQELNAPHFAEFFIAALGNAEADADKNGRVSVLEAFEYAVKLTKSRYDKKGILLAEHALLEDNGDGTGHEKADAGDGVLAKLTYFDSLPQQQAGGDAALAKLYSEKMRLEGEVEKLK
ncbi:MAG TPA: hypothetical protein PKD31_24450, partial [Blastocatellia bacterium]|nr:hypothetical protein [Blastocatellia bacterium]